MFEIDIAPILSFGTWGIRLYGLLLSLGIVAVIVLVFLEVRRVSRFLNQPFDLDSTLNLMFWAMVGGAIGARLFYVIDNWRYFLEQPGEIIGYTGIRLYGVLAGVAVAALLYDRFSKAKHPRFSHWQVCDIIAPGAMLGLAISRIGCALQGCCYGVNCDLPWSVVYTNANSYAPTGVTLHPTQLYQVTWNFLGFAMLWLLRKRLKPVGSLFLLWLAYYAAGDLLIRHFRVDRIFLFGLHQGQLIDMAVLLVTVPLLGIRIWQANKASSPSYTAGPRDNPPTE